MTLEMELAEKYKECEQLEAHVKELEPQLCAAREELSNIANAKRFDPEVFEDNKSFADWAQSRARHTLSSIASCPHEAEAKRLRAELSEAIDLIRADVEGCDDPNCGNKLCGYLRRRAEGGN